MGILNSTASLLRKSKTPPNQSDGLLASTPSPQAHSACFMQAAHKKSAQCHATRTRVLDAGRVLFWQNGYGNVSVDQICAAAEIKKGSFYHFFDSKEALVLALFDEAWELESANTEVIFNPQHSTIQQLAYMTVGLIQWQQDLASTMGRVMGCPWFDIGQEVGRSNPRIHARAQEFFTRWQSHYQSLLNKACKEGFLPADTDVSSLAAAMYASALGLLCHAKLMNNLAILNNEFPRVMARFISAPDTKVLKAVEEASKQLTKPLLRQPQQRR